MKPIIIAQGLIISIFLLLPTLLKAPNDAYYTDCVIPKKDIPQGQIIVGINTLNPQRTKDNRAFQKRGKKLAKQLGYGYTEITSGQGLLSTLEQLSSKSGMLGNVIIIAHGDSLGMFFDTDQGLYDDKVLTRRYWKRFYGLKGKKALLSEWVNAFNDRKIRFHPKAQQLWLTCSGGKIAEKISRKTGLNILACTGQVAPINTPDATAETGYYTSVGNFYRFEGGEKVNLGDLFSPYDYLHR